MELQPIPQPYPVPIGQPMPQQPIPQQFTISLSHGPEGFNITVGTNTSQMIEVITTSRRERDYIGY
jgi:hypothetical protein